jgi:oxygen-independent coproporphyrinogen-3 oxidase
MSSAAPTDISPELLARFAELGPEIPNAVAVPIWRGRFGGVDYEAALRSVSARPDESLALYVHVPFCPGRCLYCGCNTTITHDSARIDGYLDALEHEMAMVAERINGDRDVLQLHLAGGTPNYLNDVQLTRLTEMLERRFRILPDTDQSIECDPRRTSAGQLELLHALGYRRITFGVQDLEPEVQRAIGRVQSIDLVRDVYWLAREIGFETIAFDLIYGLPKQTEVSFQKTLEAVIDMAPDRVTCFGYSRITDAGPHQHAIDVHQLPNAVDRQVLFHRAVRSFTSSGYAWIGLDAFALDTDELAIAQDEGRLHRNCIGYTARPTAHMLGFGTGAVGEIDGNCVQNEPLLDDWMVRVQAGELPIAQGHRLDETDRRRRDAIGHMICNLELPEDLAIGCLDDEYARLAKYADDGLIEVAGDRLRITPTGRYFLRTLCSEHDAYFSWDRARWHFSRSN